MGENNVATLQAMFGDEWDEASLGSVLESCGGDAEAAVDLILAAGSCASWKEQQSSAVQMPPPPPSAAQLDSTHSRGETVTVVVPPGARPGGSIRVNHGGRTFQVNVPSHLSEGDSFRAAIPDPVSVGRGRRVVLPPDFLLLPGSSSSNPDELTDQQLAMMLQQEAFMAEGDAPSRRRQQQQPQQQHQQSSSSSSQSSQSMTSMFSSVGSSMRAGLASAATSVKTMTNKIQQSATGTKPQQDPEGYGRVDLHDELQDESPLHLGGPSGATTSPAPGGGAGTNNTTVQATQDDDEDNTNTTIAL